MASSSPTTPPFRRHHRTALRCRGGRCFSSHTSIPTHLVTCEFWLGARQVLKPDGVLLANLIVDGKLETPYARNLLATIDSVFGRCAVDVLHKGKPLANVEVACFASSRPSAGKPWTKNQADVDRSLLR